MRPYLINLDRSTDRLDFMDRRFGALGIRYRRVPAVDGGIMAPAQRDAVLERAPGAPFLSAGEIGCFLSHRRCWQHIVEGDEAHACVFEDDVELSPRLRGFLDGTDWIPADADIVKIETLREKIWLDRGPAAIRDGFRLGRLRTTHYGCAGYIVSRRCARRLLDLTVRISDPVDIVMFNPAAGTASRLVIYQIMPALCVQAQIRYPRGSPDHLPSTLQAARSRSRFPDLPRRPKWRREVFSMLAKLGHRRKRRMRVVVPFDRPRPVPTGEDVV